jgi:hypothetical protein
MLLVACCAVAFASQMVPTVAASRTSTGARIARLCMSGLGGTRWTVKLDVAPSLERGCRPHGVALAFALSPR